MADPGMPVPHDFPEQLRGNVHGKVKRKYDVQHPAIWQDFSLGLGGLLYRFTACAEHDDRFTKSVNDDGPGPPQPQRYCQERDLFDFFVTGQSAIECLCYSLYALGAMAEPATFDLFARGEEREINPKKTIKAYQKAFPGEFLTGEIARVIGSNEYKEWGTIRNILSHRLAPIRHFRLGSGGASAEWMNVSIDPATTRTRRQWLARQIEQLLAVTDAFVDTLP